MKSPSFLRSRVIRQTITLTRKNFLIFSKSPITTLLRALIFPVAVAVVLSILKQTLARTQTDFGYVSGIASSSKSIKDLSSALDTGAGLKLVFVRNGVDKTVVDPLINSVREEIGGRTHTSTIDDPDTLFNECPQSLAGRSDCFAAVIFTSFNRTNVDYIM